MERSGNMGIFVKSYWSDIDNNALISKNVLLYNSESNIVRISDNKIGVLQGLEGYIVVDTQHGVFKKEEEQNIKQMMADVKFNLGDEFV